jgi:CRISPR-associated protein Csm5
MKHRNRIFPLSITTLTPLHINSGARLAEGVDFYTDDTTTYVLNSDVALELALQRWEAHQEPYEATLRRWEAELAEAEAKLQKRRERNRQEIKQFDENPPRDRAKRAAMEQRLRQEGDEIKQRAKTLAERRASPPAPPTVGLPKELLQNSGFGDLINRAGWLSLDDLRNGTMLDGRPLVRYAYAGRPASNQGGSAAISELIKDVADRPYLPGSSLKGAIRSALAWAYAPELAERAFAEFSQKGRTNADTALEKELFYGTEGVGRRVDNHVLRDVLRGRRASRRGARHQRRSVDNHVLRDVLRGLHIADSAPSSVGPELLTVQVFPASSKGRGAITVDIEALPAGVDLRAALHLERYMFDAEEARCVLKFKQWPQRLQPEALAKACRERAAALIAGERKFFSSTRAPEIDRVYADLEQRLASLDARSFLLAVGWGAGWRSKTLDDRLSATPERAAEFAHAVKQYNLKNNRTKSGRFSPGDLFPATRKLVYSGGRPRQPLGWLQVTIGEEGKQ